MFSNKSLFRHIVFITIIALGLPMTLTAAQKSRQTPRALARADIPRDVQSQYDRAQDAAEILGDLARTPDKGIPRSLLDRAYGIAVFPHVIKGAFIVGGRWGKGIVSIREPGGGWSAPAYVDIAGGSFGFQIGGQSTDLVLVFTSRKGVDSLLRSKVKLGADASVAAGPVGRAAEASTDVALKAEVYAYSRSKGLFAGIALDGAVVHFNDSANEKVYGKDGRAVLASRRASVVTMPFQAALAQHSPRATK